jgi:hypothetical protein
MRQMAVSELRARFVELFGEPSRSRHKEHLVRRIAWRLQALEEGDLSERAGRRAAELARDADLRLGAPRRGRSTPATPSQATTAPRDERLPMAGTILVRPYRGQMLQVKVLEEGFEYDGRIFDSLTAVTKRITGKHWNGYHFFGLIRKGASG